MRSWPKALIAGPAFDALPPIDLLQQGLRQVAAVLAGDAGDQNSFDGVGSGRGVRKLDDVVQAQQVCLRSKRTGAQGSTISAMT